MPWIQSDVALRMHKKVRRLCSKTNWNLAEGLGKLHMFWWWVLINAEDGNLTGLEPIEYLDDIKGELSAPILNRFMIESEWIDEKGTKILVHDWLDTAGRYLIRKYQSSNLEKLKKIWKMHGKIYG